MALLFFVLTFDLSASSRPSNGRSAPSVTAQESGQPLPSDECETNFTDKIFLTIGSSNQFTKETVKFWSHFVAGTSGLQGTLCTIQVQPGNNSPYCTEARALSSSSHKSNHNKTSTLFRKSSGLWLRFLLAVALVVLLWRENFEVGKAVVVFVAVDVVDMEGAWQLCVVGVGVVHCKLSVEVVWGGCRGIGGG